MPHSNYVRAVEVTEADLTFVRVTTNVCMVCDKMGVLDIPYLDWDYYKKNTHLHIHQTLRSLSAGEREMLITGIHPVCWDELFCSCSFATDDCEVHN